MTIPDDDDDEPFLSASPRFPSQFRSIQVCVRRLRFRSCIARGAAAFCALRGRISQRNFMNQQREYLPSYSCSIPERGVATQDFLQPLEKRKEGAFAGDDSSFELAGKDGLVEPKRQQPECGEPAKDSSWPGLGMHCGYLEFPSNSRPAANVFNKRPNPVPSEDDENDSDYSRRKMHQRDDPKNADGKANLTPRSKHSATEQRRRSKINDRFQMLRDLLPHNDQKRDKASFLQEVVDYIQVLQDKVQRYEQRVAEEPAGKTGAPLNKPSASEPQASRADETSRSQDTQPQPRDAGGNGQQEDHLAVVGGVINVSAAYSQRLLETLSSAFQTSGLDMSQAHISVRIELGKPSSSSSTAKSRPSDETRTSMSA